MTKAIAGDTQADEATVDTRWVPCVTLSDCGGNAFEILVKTRLALRKAGAPKEYREQFHKEATAGDYDHLLQTVIRYCDVSN